LGKRRLTHKNCKNCFLEKERGKYLFSVDYNMPGEKSLRQDVMQRSFVDLRLKDAVLVFFPETNSIF
jgi:hypothetical protein